MAVSGVYRRGSADPTATDGGGGDGGIPDLVVVGCASRDRTSEDRRGWRLGGGATYGSLAAARLGLRVACLLGVDAEGARAKELDLLREAGVDLWIAALDSAPVFENIEQGEHRVQHWFADADPIMPRLLPGEWRRSRGWLFAPIAGELPESWGEIPSAEARVALAGQGLLRELGTDGIVRVVPPQSGATFQQAGLVSVSVDDLARNSMIETVRALMRPDAVLVTTAASRGGIVFRGRSAHRYRAFPATTVDATGAGDVFLAALMAGWLAGDEPAGPRSLRLAAAAAACSVEGPGLLGVPSRAAVLERLRR